MPGINETTLATYQNLDGANTTMLLRTFGCKPANNLTLNAGFGGSTNFKGTNAFMLEGKAKYAFNEHFSVQARLRNSLSTKGNVSQLRLSPGYKTDVSENTSVYVNPYAAAKYDTKSGKITTDIGAFAGVTQKLTPKISISGEVQKYNGLNGGAENWGINAILSYNF